MSTSILNSVKKNLGLADDYTVFDQDVIMHINSVLSTLNQLGVGPEAGYAIEDATQTWEDFLGSDPRLNSAKSYMYLCVRRLFDPPTTSFLLDAYAQQITEMEWRLTIGESGSGTPFVIPVGLPVSERIRVTDGQDIWATLDLFKITFEIRETKDPTSTLLVDLSSYVTASYDSNDIVLDWSMTPVATILLKNGFYKLDLSDIGSDPTKVIRILSGQFKVTT